jgi:hypothetical protein
MSPRSASAIPHVWASWVKRGEEGLKTCLEAGVNELGGRSMDESMSRAAGAPRRGSDAAPAWRHWARRRAGRASARLDMATRPQSVTPALTAPREREAQRAPNRRRMTSTLRAGPSRLYPELRGTNRRVGVGGSVPGWMSASGRLRPLPTYPQVSERKWTVATLIMLSLV